MEVFTPLGLAAAVTLVLLPYVRRLSIRLGIVDQPKKGKIHQEPMPYLGGLAIYFGFWVAVMLTQEWSKEVFSFFIGSTIILISGLWDDSKDISAWTKLSFQLVAAFVVVIIGGVRITFVTSLFGVSPKDLGWLATPLTIAWIVGLTNAVNLVDGLDGLAAGVSGIAAITIGIIAWMEGFPSAGMLALILGVSALAFLRYNFHPARIFMGDTGALFLGFSLAVLSIIGLTKMATTVSLYMPVLILGVPVFDTLLAIVRRMIKKVPIFERDTDHLHHRLLAMGLSHRNAVLTVYGVCVLLGISAIVIALLPSSQGMMALFLVTLAVLYGADKVGVIGRRVQQHPTKQDNPSS